MSLLTGENKEIKIRYQLPLRFDEQMKLITEVRVCVDMRLKDFDYHKVWLLIKDNVVIEANGKEIYNNGSENTELTGGKMLKYAISASKLFSEQFLVFIEQQGVQL